MYSGCRLSISIACIEWKLLAWILPCPWGQSLSRIYLVTCEELRSIQRYAYLYDGRSRKWDSDSVALIFGVISEESLLILDTASEPDVVSLDGDVGNIAIPLAGVCSSHSTVHGSHLQSK